MAGRPPERGVVLPGGVQEPTIGKAHQDGVERPAPSGRAYRRSDTDVEVSLPERRYDLAGRLLVKAVAQAERNKTPISGTLQAVAADAGRAVGAQAASNRVRRATQKARQAAVVDLLSADGYEPCPAGGGIALTNCPFHALAREETALVCGMNLAYLQGVLDGLGVTSLLAQLDPAEGQCCVRLQKR
jgi:predicted ArsR family transcriptional regulator